MSTTPATQPAPEFRIQWTGSIKVYVPIRPTVHTVEKETAVSCA